MEQSMTESPKTIRTEALKRAKEGLGTKNHRLLLVEGLLACILATVSVCLILDAFDMVFGVFSTFEEALALLFFDASVSVVCFFLIWPLYLGVVRTAVEMVNGRSVELSHFFVFYSSFRMFFRAIRIQLLILLHAFPFLLIYAPKYLFLLGETKPLPSFLPWLSIPAAVLVAFIGFCFTMRIFPFLALVLGEDEMSLGKALRRARKATKKQFFSVFAMRIRMLWRFLLSLLSIGVVTLLHTLPLILLAYGEYAAALAANADN